MDDMLRSLSLTQLLYGSSIVTVAYLIRGIAGFGSGLIAIPLLLLLDLPIALVVPLVVALDYIASASQGIKHRQAVAWREIWPLLPFAFLGVALAIYLFKTIDAVLLQRSLAVFIILYAVYTLLAKSPRQIHTRWWAVPAGGLGGLIGTLFGTGGPFYVIYLQLRHLNKTPFRATFATIFLIDGTSRIAGYLFSGFFTLEFLWLLAVLLPVMLISLYLGGQIHLTLSQETFKRAISVLLVVSSIVLLLK
jgi:uncharacterized protein